MDLLSVIISLRNLFMLAARPTLFHTTKQHTNLSDRVRLALKSSGILKAMKVALDIHEKLLPDSIMSERWDCKTLIFLYSCAHSHSSAVCLCVWQVSNLDCNRMLMWSFKVNLSPAADVGVKGKKERNCNLVKCKSFWSIDWEKSEIGLHFRTEVEHAYCSLEPVREFKLFSRQLSTVFWA